MSIHSWSLPQWQKRRARVLLASQKARWELLESNNAGFTVSESCTLGWLNVVLRHLWPTVIEKEVAEATTKQIQVRGVGFKHAPCKQRQHALPHNSCRHTVVLFKVMAKQLGWGSLKRGA